MTNSYRQCRVGPEPILAWAEGPATNVTDLGRASRWHCRQGRYASTGGLAGAGIADTFATRRTVAKASLRRVTLASRTGGSSLAAVDRSVSSRRHRGSAASRRTVGELALARLAGCCRVDWWVSLCRLTHSPAGNPPGTRRQP